MHDILTRRPVSGGIVKRWGLLALLIVFALFGLVHILEVYTGRAQHIFWNPNIYNPSLADWSKPSFLGADLQRYTTKDVIPIPCHSHNDYQRQIPLYDAISWGCTSVEADVWLFDGDLYVGHEVNKLDRNRTLRSLYVNPLVQLLERSAQGHGIFDTVSSQTLVLLIDFKTGGDDTLRAVKQQLQPLRQNNQLSYWNGTSVVSRAVTVVATGDAPFEAHFDDASYRDIFFDAPLHEFGKQQNERTDTTRHEIQQNELCHSDKFNSSTTYYASTDFKSQFGFLWRGQFSAGQISLLRSQIEAAQRCGLKVRYWGTPSWPVSLRNYVWDVLMKEGADMLNVDDLKAAAVLKWDTEAHTLLP